MARAYPQTPALAISGPGMGTRHPWEQGSIPCRGGVFHQGEEARHSPLPCCMVLQGQEAKSCLELTPHTRSVLACSGLARTHSPRSLCHGLSPMQVQPDLLGNTVPSPCPAPSTVSPFFLPLLPGELEAQ